MNQQKILLVVYKEIVITREIQYFAFQTLSFFIKRDYELGIVTQDNYNVRRKQKQNFYDKNYLNLVERCNVIINQNLSKR